MLNKLRAQHYILFLAAITGAVWFFTGYPSQDIRSVVENRLSENVIKKKALRQFKTLGYSSSKFDIMDVALLANESLLDSLQHDIGRQQAIQVLGEKNIQNLKLYYWQITFKKQGQPPSNSLSTNPINCVEGEICLQFDARGRFMAFLNPSTFIPQKNIKREALSAVFRLTADSSRRKLFAAIPDSLLERLFYFDLQKSTDSFSSYSRKPAGRIQAKLLSGNPYRYSKNDVRALANYYLTKSGWQISSLTPDTIFVKRINSMNAVNLRYMLEEPLLDQQLSLDVLVTPTGALLYLKADYNGEEQEEIIWDFIRRILILIFILVVLVIFFFRMRARAVDTRPAVVAAIVVAFIVAINMVLWLLGPQGLLNASYATTIDIVTLITMGVLAATACVAAFMLFAVSDSVTRQYWPEKLRFYDYIRQGMVLNKPIGTVLLNGVTLAFILAGYWTLLLLVFPNLFFSADSLFISQQAAWPPLRLFTYGAWISFFIILSIFAVIAVRAHGQWKKYWLTGALSVIACGIVIAPIFNYGPEWLKLVVGALFGVALVLIYLKWDILTLLLSYFLFLCLIGSASGWIISDSPDLFVFIWTLILFIIITATGFFAVWFGEDERKLTKYIPAYIEEHAYEERIKQELEIARSVQQSFLPKATPSVSHLDIAAVCIPAFETGGDYYDFIRLDDHRVAIAIGDVSGKGIQAAFYMTFVKGLLHSLCHEIDSPAEVLAKTNQLFYENASKSTFVSLIYGIIDMKEKTVTFARAGHNPILHINKNNERVEELCPNGLGIGLTKEKIFDNKIKEIQLSITDDDLFLLYTDGIPEALNETHQFYGVDSLMELMAQQKDQPAAAIIEAVSNAVNQFIGQVKQHDDMTLMAVRFRKVLNDN